MKNYNFILKLVLGIIIIICINTILILIIIMNPDDDSPQDKVIDATVITSIIGIDGATIGYLLGPKKHHNGDEDENKDEDKKEDTIVDNQDKKE